MSLPCYNGLGHNIRDEIDESGWYCTRCSLSGGYDEEQDDDTAEVPEDYDFWRGENEWEYSNSSA